MGFTGERPGRGPGYEYDDSRHRVAYDLLLPLVADRDVVDAGSGDGVGTALLASTARSVVGLDHHPDSVATATERFGSDRVRFVVADLGEPWPVEPVDVVVALQILEHFEDDDGFVARALGALRPGGTLVLTTPNVLRSFSENPYHVREYTPDELRTLLERHADDVTLRGIVGNERVEAFDARRQAEVERLLRLDPLRLRDRLPRPVVERAFATASTLVRRRASGDVPDAPITPADFHATDDDLDRCLDLLAIVTRP